MAKGYGSGTRSQRLMLLFLIVISAALTAIAFRAMVRSDNCSELARLFAPAFCNPAGSQAGGRL